MFDKYLTKFESTVTKQLNSCVNEFHKGQIVR